MMKILLSNSNNIQHQNTSIEISYVLRCSVIIEDFQHIYRILFVLFQAEGKSNQK